MEKFEGTVRGHNAVVGHCREEKISEEIII